MQPFCGPFATTGLKMQHVCDDNVSVCLVCWIAQKSIIETMKRAGVASVIMTSRLKKHSACVPYRHHRAG